MLQQMTIYGEGDEREMGPQGMMIGDKEYARGGRWDQLRVRIFLGFTIVIRLGPHLCQDSNMLIPNVVENRHGVTREGELLSMIQTPETSPAEARCHGARKSGPTRGIIGTARDRVMDVGDYAADGLSSTVGSAWGLCHAGGAMLVVMIVHRVDLMLAVVLMAMGCRVE